MKKSQTFPAQLCVKLSTVQAVKKRRDHACLENPQFAARSSEVRSPDAGTILPKYTMNDLLGVSHPFGFRMEAWHRLKSSA